MQIKEQDIVATVRKRNEGQSWPSEPGVPWGTSLTSGESLLCDFRTLVYSLYTPKTFMLTYRFNNENGKEVVDIRDTEEVEVERT